MASPSLVTGRRSLRVRRPVEAVFAALDDLHHFALLLPQLERFRIVGPDEGTGTVAVRWSGVVWRAEAVGRMLRREPPSRLVFEVRCDHMIAEGEVEIVDAGEGVSEAIYVTRWTPIGIFRRLKRMAMEDLMPRHLDEVAARFRKLVEEGP